MVTSLRSCYDGIDVTFFILWLPETTMTLV